MAQLAEGVLAERESTVSIRVVRGLVVAAEAAGVERRRLLGAAGVQPALLSNEDARLPRAHVLRMCEAALDLTDDPAFALHWGEAANDCTFAPLSHLIAHSSSFGAALQALFAYHRLIADEADYGLVEDGDRMTLRFTTLRGSSPRLRAFVAEMEAVGIYRWMRTFGVRPQCVTFAYPPPPYCSEYARIFQGVERFEEPLSGICFSRSQLSAVSPHKDDEVHRALQAIAARRVFRLTKRTPYALLLREQLIAQGKCVRPDMARAAEALGLGVRSLRRRLKAEGTSFDEVAVTAAATVAKRLLEDGNKSIQEAAFDMGYADVSGFHRAFKRWTGLTPGAYRERV